ncbi:hypothetical protein PTKIN_Ptkin04bG0114600 [Pterospermum kingtungense]
MAMENNKGNKKRAREESEDSESVVNSVPNLKLARDDSDSPEATHLEPNPDDGNVQPPKTKCIQEDFLSIMDDSDQVIGPDLAIQGLDSVIKSFEEEILVLAQTPVLGTVMDSGESRPELGFLLEASDDELGLPSSFSSIDGEQKFGSVNVDESTGSRADGFVEMMGNEFSLPNYESFELGIGDASDTNHNNYSIDFVALEGLFEPTSDISELTWQPESLSTL